MGKEFSFEKTIYLCYNNYDCKDGWGTMKSISDTDTIKYSECNDILDYSIPIHIKISSKDMEFIYTENNILFINIRIDWCQSCNCDEIYIQGYKFIKEDIREDWEDYEYKLQLS